MEKGALVRVKTSLRKAASLFPILGNVITSHKIIRKYVPPPLPGILKSSGYFVYDEKCVNIDGMEEYRTLL